jgi:hypothetical protein
MTIAHFVESYGYFAAFAGRPNGAPSHACRGSARWFRGDRQRTVASSIGYRAEQCPSNHYPGDAMSLATIILIVLVLMLVGAIPTWPHSRSWGYGPSGGIGLVAVIVIVLLLMGRL